MRIYLATWLEDNQGISLTKVSARHRLMSFFFIRSGKIKFSLLKYIRYGIAVIGKKGEGKDED